MTPPQTIPDPPSAISQITTHESNAHGPPWHESPTLQATAQADKINSPAIYSNKYRLPLKCANDDSRCRKAGGIYEERESYRRRTVRQRAKDHCPEYSNDQADASAEQYGANSRIFWSLLRARRRGKCSWRFIGVWIRNHERSFYPQEQIFPALPYFFPAVISKPSRFSSPVAPSRPRRMMHSRAFAGTSMRRASFCQSNVPRHGPMVFSSIVARASS